MFAEFSHALSFLVKIFLGLAQISYVNNPSRIGHMKISMER
nr:MAG TPA: hypothetical protein [Caudoviricetes sp.]